ncbi:MAG: sensor histidine kinase [Gemmatimonadaceae bacterium]
MKRPGFRSRLFAILLLFAVLPSIIVTVVWAGAISNWLPVVAGSAAWESVAATGERAIAEARRRAPLGSAAEDALAAHERELSNSVIQARRLQYIGSRAVPVVLLVALLLSLFLALVASRVAGHLSRQLSRPLAELVEWTARIGRGLPVPEGPSRRGAPEFETLRQRMCAMSAELETGRARALEAERLAAFRETARRVAHELRNPLTPIRFAVARLRRDAPDHLAETVEILAAETERLERMAKSFAQFGRLPEGPAADLDIAELVRYTARSTVPETMPLQLTVEEALPLVHGHHDALARALSNILINAVDACRDGGVVSVRVGRRMLPGDGGMHNGAATDREAVEIMVEDSGCGIEREQLERIWEPYVTYKQGGTGLGMAIARQTVLAHRGTVHAASEPGSGTRITLVIPVQEAGATSPEIKEQAWDPK